MCQNHQPSDYEHGDWNDIVANLGQPMSLGRKLYLIGRNNWIKIRRRSTCCGNHGQPGC